MAGGSVKVTGLKELSNAIDKLPATVTSKLRTVAMTSAQRIQARASQLAPYDEGERGPHTRGEPHLRDSIEIVEQADQKQFLVVPNTPWLPNLALWIERGTRFMGARPFMRPAGDAEDGAYKHNMVTAADRTVTEALKD